MFVCLPHVSALKSHGLHLGGSTLDNLSEPKLSERPNQPPVEWKSGSYSGRETDRSRQFSAEVSNEWSYTFTPPCAFVACILIIRSVP